MYDQAYSHLNERETEDLLKIWEENDRSVWTDIAFSALHDILQEMLGSVPPQKKAPPIKITRARPLIKNELIPAQIEITLTSSRLKRIIPLPA